MLRKKRDFLSNIAKGYKYSMLVLHIILFMSISRSKNAIRKLNIIAEEAKLEIDKVCESTLWQTLGLIYFDQLDSKDKIAKANFYYGQLQIIEEIRSFVE